MDSNTNLHIVMVPWLALGHLLPFLELSKRLAKKGHHISFMSTPKNTQRLLPLIPPSLSPLIKPIQVPLPHVKGLPADAEATIDLPSDNLRPFLRIAYDTAFNHHLSSLLHHSPPPDWIIFDYAAYWVPDTAAIANVPCAFLSLFSASTLGFSGPTSALRGEGGLRSTPEDFSKVPNWVPFPSTIAYRSYEARALFEPGVVPDASGVSESYRFAEAIDGSEFVAVRTCRELEPDWLHLLGNLYKKPIIPVGHFPPLIEEEEEEEGSEKWDNMYNWLDRQEPGSVVYAAFGSEVKLTSAQVNEIAIGLELSGLPFVWAAKAGGLPEGFVGRTEGRGLVLEGWAPQVKLLAHPSVAGFLTHCGWNSIVEGLACGVVMVLLPLIFDQGLNARSLVEKGMGVEVARDEADGSFAGEEIAKSLRLVMVDEEGERFRGKAKECKEIYGDEKLQDKYVDEFVKHLWDHRHQRAA